MFSQHAQPIAGSSKLAEWHGGNDALGLGEVDAEARWYAVWTRSRQEKTAAAMLDSLGVAHFLPLKSESRQWSDRRQAVSVPLFSCYLFVRMNLRVDNKLSVLQVPGVAGFVGNSQGPLPIPDQQVEAVRAVVERGAGCTVHSLLEAGHLEAGSLVRVVRGPLAGVEGRLVRFNSTSRLVVSIELIHRSLAVSVASEDVEPVHPLYL